MRKAWSVDQSVVSKARRAAAMARCHVGAGAVGDRAEHLLGGRVDVVEGLAAFGVDELAVDQHALLVHQVSCRGRTPSMAATSSGASGSVGGRKRRDDLAVGCDDELLEVPLHLAGGALGVRRGGQRRRRSGGAGLR